MSYTSSNPTTQNILAYLNVVIIYDNATGYQGGSRKKFK